MHGVTNARLSHRGWGRSQCNIILGASAGGVGSSPQLSVSPDARDQPLAVFSVVDRFDVHCRSLNTRLILWRRNMACKKSTKHSSHLVPTSFCPSNLLLSVSGLAGAANLTPRAATLFSLETSQAWQTWEGAASELETDSICCEQVSGEISPRKPNRRKPPPKETSHAKKPWVAVWGTLTL